MLSLSQLLILPMVSQALLSASIASAASPTSPKIISRVKWDGSSPTLSGVTVYPKISSYYLKRIIVHHSSYVEPGGPQEIKRYHLEAYGFSDIGYHYIIAADGKIYEGRNLKYMGAHAGQSREANSAVVAARRAKDYAGVHRARRLDPDYGSIGIVLDGNYDYLNGPDQAQEDSLISLLGYLGNRFQIDSTQVFTHREVKQALVEKRELSFAGNETTCPGKGLQSWIKSYRLARFLTRPSVPQAH